MTSDLGEIEAAANALIRLPDLEMESQYMEEATSFPKSKTLTIEVQFIKLFKEPSTYLQIMRGPDFLINFGGA